MELNSLLAGKFPIDIDTLPDLVLVVPKAGDVSRLTALINRKVAIYADKVKDVLTGYTKLDAERDLLTKYPDYYSVIEKAQKEKNKILLELSERDTPDERFLKTPDEILKLSDEELDKYLDYYRSQYKALEEKYLQNPLIKKSFEYMQYKESLYASTDDYTLDHIRNIFWLIVMAENSKGEKYFKSIEEGMEKIDNLPYPEYKLLLEMWDGILSGFDLSF